MKKKPERDFIIETNRRLQEAAQELYMAKKELEKKNKLLKIAEEKEKQQVKELEQELNSLKTLSAGKAEKETRSVSGEKLDNAAAEDLSLTYIYLLESYAKTKDIGVNESLVDDLCQKFIEYGITPKGIVNMHIKCMAQVKTVGDLETKRITYESRMVLLKIMTNYASILLKKS